MLSHVHRSGSRTGGPNSENKKSLPCCPTHQQNQQASWRVLNLQRTVPYAYVPYKPAIQWRFQPTQDTQKRSTVWAWVIILDSFLRCPRSWTRVLVRLMTNLILIGRFYDLFHVLQSLEPTVVSLVPLLELLLQSGRPVLRIYLTIVLKEQQHYKKCNRTLTAKRARE